VSNSIVELLTILVLAAFVGFEVIAKVPSILHTPLMSGTNAIHGVILVGAILVLGQGSGTAEMVLGFIAVTLATVNVVGGFVVTDRMLEMFKPRRPEAPKQASARAETPAEVGAATAATAEAVAGERATTDAVT
jgi:H+-translocating NAD(P) transhydrogenase subunit alpha